MESLNNIKMLLLSKLIYGFHTIPIKTAACFLLDKNCQVVSNIYMKYKEPTISKPILEKKRTNLGDLH